MGSSLRGSDTTCGTNIPEWSTSSSPSCSASDLALCQCTWREQQMAQVSEPLLPMWETWIERLALGPSLAQSLAVVGLQGVNS